MGDRAPTRPAQDLGARACLGHRKKRIDDPPDAGGALFLADQATLRLDAKTCSDLRRYIGSTSYASGAASASSVAVIAHMLWTGRSATVEVVVSLDPSSRPGGSAPRSTRTRGAQRRRTEQASRGSAGEIHRCAVERRDIRRSGGNFSEAQRCLEAFSGERKGCWVFGERPSEKSAQPRRGNVWSPCLPGTRSAT